MTRGSRNDAGVVGTETEEVAVCEETTATLEGPGRDVSKNEGGEGVGGSSRKNRDVSVSSSPLGEGDRERRCDRSAPPLPVGSCSPLPALTWSHVEARAMLLETLGAEVLSSLERSVPTPPLETVFRCTPGRGTVSEAIALLSDRTRSQLSGPAHEHVSLHGVLIMPGSGPHRLEVADPASLGEIALDQRAAEAVLRGADPFVPGVIAVSAGLEQGNTVLITAAEVPRRNEEEEKEKEKEEEGEDGAARGTEVVSLKRSGLGSAGSGALQAAEGALDVTGDLKAPAMLSSSKARLLLPPFAPCLAETRGTANVFAPLTKGTVLDRPSGAPPSSRTSLPPPPPSSSSSLPHVPVPAQLWSPRLVVAVGRAALSRSGVLQARSGLAATCSSRLFRAPALGGGELAGRGMLQNLPSIAAARALRPQPHWKVLDACASPGGKSTAVAEQLDPARGGRVVALDRTHGKVADIRRLAEELGLAEVVQAYRADATKLFSKEEVERRRRKEGREGKRSMRDDQGREGLGGADDCAPNRSDARPSSSPQTHSPSPQDAPAASPAPPQKRERSAGSDRALAREARREANRARHGHAPPPRPDQEPSLPPQELESYDAVLVDAPCSGVGQRPRLTVPHSLRELATTAAYQKRILRQAVYALRPGGALVFSTCTVSPFENECNVRWLLDEFPEELALEDARPEDASAPRRVGRHGLCGERTVQGLDAAWLQEIPDKKATKPNAAAKGDDANRGNRATNAKNAEAQPVAQPLAGTIRLLSESEAPLVRRFDPGMGDDDVIGFFCARFRKTASCFGESNQDQGADRMSA